MNVSAVGASAAAGLLPGAGARARIPFTSFREHYIAKEPESQKRRVDIVDDFIMGTLVAG